MGEQLVVKMDGQTTVLEGMTTKLLTDFPEFRKSGFGMIPDSLFLLLRLYFTHILPLSDIGMVTEPL